MIKVENGTYESDGNGGQIVEDTISAVIVLRDSMIEYGIERNIAEPYLLALIQQNFKDNEPDLSGNENNEWKGRE